MWLYQLGRRVYIGTNKVFLDKKAIYTYRIYSSISQVFQQNFLAENAPLGLYSSYLFASDLPDFKDPVPDPNLGTHVTQLFLYKCEKFVVWGDLQLWSTDSTDSHVKRQSSHGHSEANRGTVRQREAQ